MPASPDADQVAELLDQRHDVADDATAPCLTQLCVERLRIGGQLVVLRAAPGSRRTRPRRPSCPIFIAVCVPLIRGTLRKPALSPISAPPGNTSFGHRLQPAVVDRARAIGHALAALQDLGDRRMRLPPLHFLERREIRVGVVEPRHEAERDLPVRLVIQEPAAVRARVSLSGQPCVWITRPGACLSGSMSHNSLMPRP